MPTHCLKCKGRGKIEHERKRGGLFGRLRRPEAVTEKCPVCNGTGVVDEGVLRLTSIVHAQLSNGGHTCRSETFEVASDAEEREFEENIKQLSSTTAGVDQLIAIFLQTRRANTWHFGRRAIGARLAAISRRDVLFGAVQRSDTEYGVGQRHAYWHDVLEIAKMFAAAGEPDGISLGFQVPQSTAGSAATPATATLKRFTLS